MNLNSLLKMILMVDDKQTVHYNLFIHVFTFIIKALKDIHHVYRKPPND